MSDPNEGADLQGSGSCPGNEEVTNTAINELRRSRRNVARVDYTEEVVKMEPYNDLNSFVPTVKVTKEESDRVLSGPSKKRGISGRKKKEDPLKKQESEADGRKQFFQCTECPDKLNFASSSLLVAHQKNKHSVPQKVVTAKVNSGNLDGTMEDGAHFSEEASFNSFKELSNEVDLEAAAAAVSKEEDESIVQPTLANPIKGGNLNLDKASHISPTIPPEAVVNLDSPNFNHQYNGVVAITDETMRVPLYVPCSGFILKIWQLAVVSHEKFSWKIVVDNPERVHKIVTLLMKMMEGQELDVTNEEVIEYLEDPLLKLVGYFHAATFVTYFICQSSLEKVCEFVKLTVDKVEWSELIQNAILYSAAIRIQDVMFGEENGSDLVVELPERARLLIKLNAAEVKGNVNVLLAHLKDTFGTCISTFPSKFVPVLLEGTVSHGRRKQVFSLFTSLHLQALLLDPGVSTSAIMMIININSGYDCTLMAKIDFGNRNLEISVHTELVRELLYKWDHTVLLNGDWVTKRDIDIVRTMLYRAYTSIDYFPKTQCVTVEVFHILQLLKVRDIWFVLFQNKAVDAIVREYGASLVLQFASLLGKVEMLTHLADNFATLFPKETWKTNLSYFSVELAANVSARLLNK